MDWCGTACCIAGAAVTFERPELVGTAARSAVYDQPFERPAIRNSDGAWITWDVARELLGLSEIQANQMFAPWEVWYQNEMYTSDWPRNSQIINAAWAARTIRRYMELGDIRWDLTKEA